MAPTNWDNQIDLTADSDDDSGPLDALLSPQKLAPQPLPQNVRHLYRPPAPASKPKQSNVPLPGSQRRDIPPSISPLVKPSHGPLLNGATHAITPPSDSTRRESAGGFASASVDGRRNGTEYVPVFAAAHQGNMAGFTSGQQAEKRRKLSVPGKSTPANAHSRSGSGASTNSNAQNDRRKQANGPSGFSAFRTDGRTLVNLKNKTPSVHSLNTALKETSTKIPFAADILSAQPRALHIGREPDERDGSISATPVATSSAPSAAPARPAMTKSEPVGVEEMIVEREERGFTPGDLTIRPSSVKKAPALIEQKPYSPSLPVPEPRKSSSIRTGSKSAPLTFSGPISSPNFNDRGSVISDTVIRERDKHMPGSHPLNNLQRQPSMSPTAEHQTSRKKYTLQFSDEESHLLIFLKEVKRLAWKNITKEFTKHFSGRSYPALQGHYSTKLNKRDRSQDPPTLKLPPCFAHEAAIDWATVHAENPGPRGMRSLNQEASALQHQFRHHQLQQQAWTKPIIDTVQDYSSGAESAHRRERPRRAVPVKDYTWPRRHRQSQAADEVEEDEFGFPELAEADTRLTSDEPPELQPAPEKAIPVDNEPINMAFDDKDAVLAISAQKGQLTSSGGRLPYLPASQRLPIANTPIQYEWDQLCSRDWQGTLIHVGFATAELDVVERALAKTLNSPHAMRLTSRRKTLQRLMRGLTEPKLLQLTALLRYELPNRDQKSIDGFLEDAREGKIRATSQRIERLAAARPNRVFSSEPKISTSSMIRQRELGIQSRRGWNAASKPLSYVLKNRLLDSLGPAYSYTGASSDVHAVAWSVDGQCFAAGAICVDDPHSMQYNRPNNLLYGDVSYKSIHELGEHSVDRPRTESGPNSTHAMYASQDPKLYKTISSVAFSPNGKFMFSAGYDEYVCMWKATTDGSQPELITAMRHKAEVDILSVSCHGILATASKKWSSNAVKVLAIDEENPTSFQRLDFASQKAATRPDLSILPTALQFEPNAGRLLLAGFGANVRHDGRDTNGDICLWDVQTQQQLSVHGSSKNVFDVAFNKNQRQMPWFAVGCVAGQHVNRGTRSIVRLYDGYGFGRYSMNMELECRALDMNDVVWCPFDEHLLAAGCTSGRAYVWDLRWPNQFLRELAHGRSLMPLDDIIDREITDTGIRFLSWGENATRLYTGSSDGVVKVWNVVRSEEETFVRDLVTVDSGIMSGAFSPDKSKLIIGEVNGSVNVLEVGRDDCTVKDAERLKYVPYKAAYEEEVENEQCEAPLVPESGIAIATELLQSGQIMNVPMGGLPIRQAVQGTNYAGPFDNSVDAPFLREQALEFQYSLSHTPAPQCTISSCVDGIIKVTNEEIGDSGRSTDRIPDELRRQWRAIGSDMKIVSGKSRCANCGRAARPSSSAPEDGRVLCERCSFTCFRCGGVNKIQPSTERLVCAFCKRAWEIGALGYECVKETGSRIDSSDVPSLNGYGKDLFMAKLSATEQLEDNVSFGDEMNALTDYYYSLAIGRPESPPL